MIFDNDICQFNVLATCSKGPLPLSLYKMSLNVGGTLIGMECVDSAASDRSSNWNSAPRYALYLIFNRLKLTNLKCNLYSVRKEWSELLL